MLSINASRRLEQQQLLESLRSYDPWGRAGGGAPAGDVRRRDLMSRYIYPQFPTLWGDSKDRIPPIRIRHRPRRSILTSDLMKNPAESFPKEIPDCIEHCRHDRHGEIDKTFSEVRSNKVWSGDPWDSRGPWGSRGPGGNPWRPAGHVGRNFHHSMGWTTENTFNFPSINNAVKNCICDNDETMRRMNSIKKGVRIKDDKNYDSKMDDQKMPPIDVKNNSSTDGKRCAGRTPNKQLLNMTGGIELVPLMRARDWTVKQRPPHVDYLTQIVNNSHSVFQ